MELHLRCSHNLPNKSIYSFLKFHVDAKLGNKTLKRHRARRRKASAKLCVLQTPKLREIYREDQITCLLIHTLGCRSLISLPPRAKSSQTRASSLFSFKHSLNVILHKATTGTFRSCQRHLHICWWATVLLLLVKEVFLALRGGMKAIPSECLLHFEGKQMWRDRFVAWESEGADLEHTKCEGQLYPEKSERNTKPWSLAPIWESYLRRCFCPLYSSLIHHRA